MIMQVDLHCSPGGVKWAMTMQVHLRWAADRVKWANVNAGMPERRRKRRESGEDHAGAPAVGR
jgi:hypothetical protein